MPTSPSWKAKTMKKQWKNKLFHKIANKNKKLPSITRTWQKLSCGARKTAFFNIFVIKDVRPNQFWKHPKLSSRAGESAFCNICKARNWLKNAGSRLPFSRDVPSENDVFEGVGPKSATPSGTIWSSNFEAISVNKLSKNWLRFRRELFEGLGSIFS